jgi:hypothetical protein
MQWLLQSTTQLAQEVAVNKGEGCSSWKSTVFRGRK